MNTVLFGLYGTAFAETATDDEVDDLFCQLECIEPPAFIVDSIMNAVARLPRYGSVSDECDDLIALAI
jgi:hypothetical protein